MSNRKSSENSDSISLFPFLAVLLCTMGALLVMLVILVQEAAQRALLPEASSTQLASDPPSAAAHRVSQDEDRLRRELDQVQAHQRELAELRAEGKRRLENERARLSHAEEHTRRLEEELAKLSIAAEQLKLTEKNQTVDQQQAEKELARLEQLVADTEEQLDKLREEASTSNKSYAIVPYKGPNGTYRKPIYIECTGKGITIHPEGLHLTETDFIAPSWPGNPLAAILRASREYLNQKAAQEGAPEPPDPYPLMLVRPDGIEYYALARAAITSWDSDYGYEFVEADMKLTFRESADPQLYRVQNHAMLIARDRLVHLVQAAPSRFRGMRTGGGPPGGSGGEGSGYGAYGSGDGQYGNAGTQVAGSAAGGGMGGVQDSAEGELQGNDGGGSPSGDAQIGNLAGTAGPDGEGGPQLGYADGTEASHDGAGGGNASGGEPNLAGPRYAQQGGNSGAAGGGQAMASNAPSQPLDGADAAGGGSGQQMAAGGSAGGDSGSSGGGGSSGMSFGQQGGQTIADAKGANWAVGRPGLRSVAIRRPIPVVVRDNQMIILPAAGARRSVEASAQVISLDQSIHDISDNFTAAVKERIDDWGLAGSGMYWKPVLELTVEPHAEMTATRIVHLLHDSGVEVQLPATARTPESSEKGVVR